MRMKLVAMTLALCIKEYCKKCVHIPRSIAVRQFDGIFKTFYETIATKNTLNSCCILLMADLIALTHKKQQDPKMTFNTLSLPLAANSIAKFLAFS